MMQIFFIVLLDMSKMSSIDFAPGVHNSHNSKSNSVSRYQKLKNEEYQVIFNNCELNIIDVETNDQTSEYDNCDTTSSKANLININKITDEDQMNLTCSVFLRIFSCRFIMCCSVLLALFVCASYYCFGIYHRAWGFLVAISFLLSILIFCAIINGLEKLKEMNKI